MAWWTAESVSAQSRNSASKVSSKKGMNSSRVTLAMLKRASSA